MHVASNKSSQKRGFIGALDAIRKPRGSEQHAAEELRRDGLDVGVANARFVKPLDKKLVLRALRECDFVLTVDAILDASFSKVHCQQPLAVVTSAP